MDGQQQTGKMTVGLKDLYYAKLLTDVKDGTTTYAVPKRLAGAINANLNPNGTQTTVYVDDVPAESVSSQGLLEIELGIDALPKDVAAEVFGYRIDNNGVLAEGSSQSQPYIALAFRSETTDGGYKYVWLYKGKLQPPSEEFQTKGESVEIKTGTVSGQFVNRASDGEKKMSVHSNDTDIEPTVITEWFTKVYTPDFSTPSV
ncbi:major tail protein [Priestia endophytica]|uniref:major tail protein n=1 Tax=Priestia endophytica TaxID=135735 RepID=UPI00203B5186|nr:major tail protein [Priestia endophytica]MCM3536595.1 phage tail protein [Priestia endophytica]